MAPLTFHKWGLNREKGEKLCVRFPFRRKKKGKKEANSTSLLFLPPYLKSQSSLMPNRIRVQSQKKESLFMGSLVLENENVLPLGIQSFSQFLIYRETIFPLIE
uniref:Uncharacterized protein n=1 Tax=Caenorhabditis tropicalis TaxID=1561998 RepID=A0A1I7UYS0_9PELO